MTAKNDITGDDIKSKGISKAFEENFDRIFRKPKPEADEWDEDRIDTIGQNGNTGEHYEPLEP